ncbi:MAG TPA: hypothetical protein DCM28_09460 [Phycisphaerales bacterium]|nr:hypothetical protein [Phycisphaerales bacterium]HCD34889.1 hypothetical protein [Phycisphaerales bacterium]|tara:strand:- start:241 stop:1416 length:1176 start_codon:yes stop_codon:yes gene_type:complete
MAIHKGRLQIGIQGPADESHGRNLICGVEQYARDRGNWDFWWDRQLDVSFAKTYPLDALITAAHQQYHIDEYKKLNIPVVCVTGTIAAGHLPLVTIDNPLIGQTAADYLMDLGFDRLAFFKPKFFDNDLRFYGFDKRIKQRNPNAITMHFPWPDEMNALTPIQRVAYYHQWLDQLQFPIAVFAYNDIFAMELMMTCRSHGLRVPEDIAILGVDDDELACRLSQTPLSSIDTGAFQAGYQAAQLLDQMIQGKKVPKTTQFIKTIGVVSRQSTDVLAVEDRDLASALTLIRRHACNGISATEVLDKVMISRTSMEQRFHKLLGRTIHQEILRVRLEKARYLLRTTDLPMPDIADRCGFSYASQLSHIFKRQTGTTPRHYRLSMRQAPTNTQEH